MKTIYVILFLIIVLGVEAFAKEKIITTRKTQKVDFEEETIDGQSRHPDGSYLVQKRSVDFIPLYKIKERFDENIKSSVDYLK